MVRQSDEGVRAMVTVASLILAQDTTAGDVEAAAEIAMRDVGNTMQLYLSRFEANMAATGQAFGSDQVTTDDLEYCRVVSQMAYQALEGQTE